jgi:hypothetical protein
MGNIAMCVKFKHRKIISNDSSSLVTNGGLSAILKTGIEPVVFHAVGNICVDEIRLKIN